MKNNKISAKRAVAGILALGMAGAATQTFAVPDSPKMWEKCAGVAKAGMNDCGALDGSHACAAQAESDNSAQEWVYTPEGTCAKLGGKVAKVKPAK